MQRFTVKNIILPTKEKSPIVIETSDGARMSGFDVKLADIQPGSVIEVELEVKGKFNNIKKWQLVSGQTPPAAVANTLPAAFPEEQTAVLGAVYLIGRGEVDKESRLGKKTLNWLMAHIPGDEDPAGIKAAKVAPKPPREEAAKPPEAAADDTFKNVGQLFDWAFRTYHLPASQLLKILDVPDTYAIKDFGAARKKIEGYMRNPLTSNPDTQKLK